MSDHTAKAAWFQYPRLRNANSSQFFLTDSYHKGGSHENFLRLDGLSILSVQYMYIDLQNITLRISARTEPCFRCGLKNEILIDDSTPDHHSLQKPEERLNKFEKSMELLCNKMLLSEHKGLYGFCK